MAWGPGVEARGGRLTGVLSGQLQLQLLHLPDQQGHVLQCVPVLQQQLVHAGLRLQPRRRLRRQLVLQQVNLQKEAAERRGDVNANAWGTRGPDRPPRPTLDDAAPGL